MHMHIHTHIQRMPAAPLAALTLATALPATRWNEGCPCCHGSVCACDACGRGAVRFVGIAPCVYPSGHRVWAGWVAVLVVGVEWGWGCRRRGHVCAWGSPTVLSLFQCALH